MNQTFSSALITSQQAFSEQVVKNSDLTTPFAMYALSDTKINQNQSLLNKEINPFSVVPLTIASQVESSD
jgi:hypothetical protein